MRSIATVVVALSARAGASLFCRFTDGPTHTYTEPVPLKYEKLAIENIRGYTDIFTVQEITRNWLVQYHNDGDFRYSDRDTT